MSASHSNVVWSKTVVSVCTDVGISVVHSIDVTIVAADSLECVTDCGTCGSLCLLLGTNDHKSEMDGATLVLVIVVLRVSNFESMSIVVFGTVTLPVVCQSSIY